ncbi:MAG: hypothetical protein DRI24_01710 [Deltaproteobacteria bacterium]|nr:MAG: hypothetical protein DRI24_01710 [Deltaproteobacteria bacterium]
MAKTVEQILGGARIILQDLVLPYRNSQDDLLSALNAGLYELKRIRPDAWLTYYGQELPQYADNATDLAASIPTNPMFYQSLIYFVAGYAELKDDEYSVDSRASLLLRAFGSNNTKPGSIG